MFTPDVFVDANPVSISDGTAVRKIIKRYDLTLRVRVERYLDEWLLRMAGDTWPLAKRLADGWQSCGGLGIDEDLASDGAEQFLAFLLDLAPYLLEPLTIRAIQGWGGLGQVDAREWHVEPGAKEVEVNGFVDRSPAS